MLVFLAGWEGQVDDSRRSLDTGLLSLGKGYDDESEGVPRAGAGLALQQP